MPVALAIALSVLLGSPVAGALSAVQIAALVGIGIKEAPMVIKLDAQVIAFMKSAAFRQMLAANGDAAIRWQNRQMEY